MWSELDEARARVRVLVLTGFGLNCECETAHAFRMCGAQVDQVHLSDMLWKRAPRALADYHVLAMIGGFSFGDHIGAGVVYANRLRYRLREELGQFVGQGGLMLGICNGFQTMVRLGVLPGLDRDYETQRATLASNDRIGYRNAWVRLRAEPKSPCVWTRGIEFIDLPARHGEGKFLAASDRLLQRIEKTGLVAVRYVDKEGAPTQEWPSNPNGSPNAIAGICDPTGRIFGLMPHPDAYLFGIHHPQWPRKKLQGTLKEEGEGMRVFRNGVDHVAERLAREEPTVALQAEGGEVTGSFAMQVGPAEKASVRDRKLDKLLTGPLFEAASKLGVVPAADPHRYAKPLDGRDDLGRTRFSVRGRAEGGRLVPVKR